MYGLKSCLADQKVGENANVQASHQNQLAKVDGMNKIREHIDTELKIDFSDFSRVDIDWLFGLYRVSEQLEVGQELTIGCLFSHCQVDHTLQTGWQAIAG